MVQLAALLPVFTSIGLGSIAAAFIARGVAIAQLRQAWINGLREDLAEFVARRNEEITVQRDVRNRIREGGKPTPDDDARLYESILKLDSTLMRIGLRLNAKERPHRLLWQKCEELRTIGIDDTGRWPLIQSIIADSQKVLKWEWEVTKWSYFAPAINYLRGNAWGIEQE